jgi:hypothetical protein
VITSALLVVAFAMLDGIGCNLYAQRIAAATTGAASPLYKPAQILEGRLCTRHDCTAAVLVQGLLSIDTLAEIRERAVATSPAVLTVCFNSPGGTFESSEAAGALPANVSTCVADLVGKDGAQRLQALCASACAWTWMAGSKKAIYGSNTVGFHAPYQYDAAACVPGNRLKAYLSVAMGWIDDVEKKRFDRATRAVRHRLRLASVGKGPTELYSVDVEQAQALGLQPRQVVPAAFYVAPAGHASTRR